MAYSLRERFPPPPKFCYLLDPGAYQNTVSPLLRSNKVPFLSKCARNSGAANKIWTHAIYNANVRTKIQNCTSLISKVPRFPYEALTKDDIEKLLCQCGIKNPCQCPVEEEKEEIIICQAKVRRKLFKGPGPKSVLGQGLSVPSKKDSGFKISPDGTKTRNFVKVKEESPPFYYPKVFESSAFYQGCKWSKWTSRRDQKPLETRPGPADYTIENTLTNEPLCAEKVRALKHKTSKQYRYIEMVQRQNILEGRPGPADYSPNFPKGAELKWVGPRAARFTTNKYDVKPGPAAHCIKRHFDKVEPPLKSCHAKLPAPAFFGIKATRFKPRREEGPSPASYDIQYKPKRLKYCKIAPFGSSSQRFKEQAVIEDEEDDEDDDDDINDFTESNKASDKNKKKSLSTWYFKSKTIRMKPLLKKNEEPSPADLPQPSVEGTRSLHLQCISPFLASEERFQTWFNCIPVHGSVKTPGPAYYCLHKPKCLPAVSCGPLCRTRRFTDFADSTPAPNTYKIDGGIETILATHNQKLKESIANKHKFHWTPPAEPKKLSLEAQETILLNKTISLLDITDIFDYKKSVSKKPSTPQNTLNKPKLLRCFLESRGIPRSV